MDTISKLKPKAHLLNSLRVRIFLIVVLLLAGALLILNLYPVQIVRQQMVSAAQQDLLGRVSSLSMTLGDFSTLSSDNVHTAVTVLDVTQYTRILVVDARGVVLYDNERAAPLLGKLCLFPEIVSALSGNESFTCIYTDTSFGSYAAAPIMHAGQSGVVYLYHNVPENAALLADIRTNLLNISLAVALLVGFFLLLFGVRFGRRFNVLLRGIEDMSSGDYARKIALPGRDELSEIAQKFNSMGSRLAETETMRRQFVSDASHELKTPLASIKLLSDSMVQNPHISAADMREFAGDIGDEITRLSRITEGLLNLSRMEALPGAERRMCDLAQTVQRSAQLLQGTAALYDVSIVLHMSGDYPVRSNPDGMQHIVFNLMENAVKYNRPGGHVWVTLHYQSGFIVLAVKDDGIGIPAEDLSQIYERFYRVDKARSRGTGGTGLGLSIVHQWVQSLDCDITVRSTVGEGTEFRVQFPAYEANGRDD